jgi:hypothetical protein
LQESNTLERKQQKPEDVWETAQFSNRKMLWQNGPRNEAGIVPAVGESKGAIGTSCSVLTVAQSESEGVSKNQNLIGRCLAR